MSIVHAEFLHYILVIISIISLLILVPCFILSAAREPGFLKKEIDYIDLVTEMIDQERDLWNLCTYCEVIKSQTSFHCLFCKKCVELFDHHCPYINNCLGYRNAQNFFLFVLFYFVFLLAVFLETIRYFFDAFYDSKH